MKRLVLTMVALVAMATTSFAQYSDLERVINNVLSQSSSTYSYPSVSYNASPLSTYNPSTSYNTSSVTYSIPSTINYNTTTVSGYTRSNGTYVDSYIKTMPNNTNWDNFSTKGNINPFTGSTGHRARDYSADALNYGRGHTIHTGSRGGQYYYNSRGNKTYVPKRNLW